MGNSLTMTCFHPKAVTDFSSDRAETNPGRKKPASESPEKKGSSGAAEDDDLIRKQALEAVLLFRRHQSKRSASGPLLPLDRSTSVRDSSPGSAKRKQGSFPRSSSTRPSSLTGHLLEPHHLLDQDKGVDGLETKRFVLVHGGGFGAWCWYKTIAMLKQSGFEVDAMDLTGSGIHSFNTHDVKSIAQYVKPLTDFLEKLENREKVILVGHDFGGACISYAMELHPSKVAKAVFVAGTMLVGGQCTLDLFSHQAGADGLMQRAKIFLYGNGEDNSPTAIDFDRTLMKDFLFNQSPDKDVALASVSLRPLPFAPVLERLSLSRGNYGSVRRFYVKTQDDYAIPISLQETMITADPPEQVFQLKGSDHSPFFSKPQTLHKVLLEISRIPLKRVCA